MRKNDPHPDTLLDFATNRRTLLSGAATLAVGTRITGASAQDSTPAAVPANGVQPDGSWVYTDARGVTVTLPKAPERVVADLAAAAPLWDYGVHPNALHGGALDTEAAWGNIDRDTPVIANSAGELNLEALVELEPDLYVTISWRPEEPDGVLWGFGDEGVQAQVKDIVPVIALSATGMLDESMAAFEELAGLLGADLESDDLVAARGAYADAVETFRSVAAEQSELTALFAYIGDGAAWYAATTERWADLAFYQSLGLNLVIPDNAVGGYWEELSFEQALKYPSDLLFNSTRGGMWGAAELQAHATFSAHPAVAAGQIGGWNQDFIQSYQGMAANLLNLAETLRPAENVTG